MNVTITTGTHVKNKNKMKIKIQLNNKDNICHQCCKHNFPYVSYIICMATPDQMSPVLDQWIATMLHHSFPAKTIPAT